MSARTLGLVASAETGEAGPALRISPEPSEEELAAIAAAVVAISRTRAARVSNVAPPEDRWRSAARREALRSTLRRSVTWR